MMKYLKWIILAVLAVALVVGVFLVNKLTNKPVDVEERTPTTTESVFTEADEELRKTTWEEYQAMTKEEQTAFRKSFSSLTAHNVWYHEALDAYNAKQDVTIIGPDQSIDINDMIASGQ